MSGLKHMQTHVGGQVNSCVCQQDIVSGPLKQLSIWSEIILEKESNWYMQTLSPPKACSTVESNSVVDSEFSTQSLHSPQYHIQHCIRFKQVPVLRKHAYLAFVCLVAFLYNFISWGIPCVFNLDYRCYDCQLLLVASNESQDKAGTKKIQSRESYVENRRGEN